VEVLDDDGRACSPGQIGRVVVTPLHNFAMPLIRYETGDFAELGAPCACGRGLPVLARVLGRDRNCLWSPAGERLWPMLDLDALRRIVPLDQIQLIQDGASHIDARVVVREPVSEAQRESLERALREALGHAFGFSFTTVDEIPRHANGKFEPFISQIPTQAD
jgi:phenylacetate-CoA ligase